jgi:hypothetical protein
MKIKATALSDIKWSNLPGLCFKLLTVWLGSQSSAAFAEVITSAELSARSQLAANPYLAAGEDTESASATISVSPSVKVTSELSSFDLTGRVSHTEFTRRYRAATSYGATAAYRYKVNARLDLRAGANFDSLIVGADDILTAAQDDDGLVPFDPALNVLQQRRKLFGSNIGFQYRGGASDQLDVGLSSSAVRYGRRSFAPQVAQDFNSLSGRISYSRKVSERTMLGLSASASDTDYLNRRDGDARDYSVQATANIRFSSRITLTAGAGPTFASLRTPTGARVNRTGFGGSLSVCDGDSMARTCVFGSRSNVPSSLGGLRTTTNWGVSYMRRLSERSEINGSASFGLSPRNLTGRAVSSGYARAELGYNRQIAQNLKGFATVGYSDGFRDVTARRANYQANFGITFLLGRKK